MDKREILQNQIKANEEKEKALELKLKNTNRALNIAKTLFGMVDELDSTDFGAEKGDAHHVLNKEKSETAEN